MKLVILSQYEIICQGEFFAVESMTANELLDRIKDLYGIKSDTALAEKLGVAQNTVSGWRARNAIPPILERIIGLNDISLDEIIKGVHTSGKNSPAIVGARARVSYERKSTQSDNIFKALESSHSDLYRSLEFAVNCANDDEKKAKLNEMLKQFIKETL
ncbi:MAG: helix-turn-helix domain-containing protein [Campylobacterales bacterium]